MCTLQRLHCTAKNVHNKHIPADAAGGEEEPVHEDARAVVVGVVGQKAVPLVLLLAGTVPRTAGSARLTEN